MNKDIAFPAQRQDIRAFFYMPARDARCNLQRTKTLRAIYSNFVWQISSNTASNHAIYDMNNIRPVLFLLCLALCSTALEAFAGRDGFAPQPRPYTVLSYNVRNCFTDEGKMDIDNVASTILECGVDFVALQELDSITERCDSLYILGELAARTGMYPCYAPAIKFNGGKYGLGILSRQQPISARQIPLPGKEEARTLLIAEFQDIVFACTHLSLTEKDRFASLPLIEAEAARYDKPFILAGDFNDTPGSAFINELEKAFSIHPSGNAPTYPATNPKVHIDYIATYTPTGLPLVWMGASVLEHKIASDHLPLLNRFYLWPFPLGSGTQR